MGKRKQVGWTGLVNDPLAIHPWPGPPSQHAALPAFRVLSQFSPEQHTSHGTQEAREEAEAGHEGAWEHQEGQESLVRKSK